ncbi:MAG: OmpH family outer membrane protein [Saprospiraceae bacterium]
MTKSYILSLILTCLVMTMGISQKYAYINSTQLLLKLPQVKAADDQLETYQKSLVSKGESMVKGFETEYNKYVAEAQKGTLTGLQRQQRESALAQQQQEIQKYEKEVQLLIGTKREQLYKPILDKVKAVVEQIGKDGEYTMIFDQSVGGLIYSVEADNLMDQVKSKLGI